ncbi:MAG TPA: peptidyl-prolyl cis-trans isomerase [Solirubrobacterales bacterium]
MRRFGLLVFGVGFVVLFAIVAIAEGVGDPSVPAEDVAIVEDVPGDDGNITKAKFDHALEQAAAEAKLPKVPKPGDDQYEELRDGALERLLQTVWVRGQAAEMGISVTDEEVAEKAKELREQQFKSEAEYQKAIKELHLTQADVNEVMELQILSPKIEEKARGNPSPPSDAEVEDYYEEVKATQFTQPATRDVRLILNKDKKKAESAKALLEKDSSPENWLKVAKKYSTESLSKGEGGLRRGLKEGDLEEPVNALIFETPEDELEGVIGTPQGFYVFVVENSTPESVQSLDDVRDQITSPLEEQAGEAAFSEFVLDFEATWRSRTFCAAGFEFKRCASFEENVDPAAGDPLLEKCRQEVPVKEFPDACPAPVRQLAPALPGTVTLLAPGGTGSSLGGLSGQATLPQRPRPAGLPPAEEEAPLTEGAPVVP